MYTLMFDLNNLAMRLFFLREINSKSKNPEYGLWHFMMFDSIFEFMMKVPNIVEVILAVDFKGSWRHKFYSPYKADRKKKRDSTGTDWPGFYAEYDNFIEMAKSHFPFKTLKIDDCEADDTIGCLCNYLSNSIIIHSRDEDYMQCCNSRISQYDVKKGYRNYPVTFKINDKPYTFKSRDEFIVTKALMGQMKDNIYNVKTPTDFKITDKIKKKPSFGIVGARKLMAMGSSEMMNHLKENKLMDNFKRNIKLIDFRQIPNEIQCSIRSTYDNYALPHPDKFTQCVEENLWVSYAPRLKEMNEKLNPLYGYKS